MKHMMDNPAGDLDEEAGGDLFRRRSPNLDPNLPDRGLA
jgi:hypothetical protein